jgi:hypothetical protein
MRRAESEKEIRLSIDAHLMAALCLEAAINEFGQKRLEKGFGKALTSWTSLRNGP